MVARSSWTIVFGRSDIPIGVYYCYTIVPFRLSSFSPVVYIMHSPFYNSYTVKFCFSEVSFSFMYHFFSVSFLVFNVDEYSCAWVQKSFAIQGGVKGKNIDVVHG